jgi:ABC-2 type transport system permease protein
MLRNVYLKTLRDLRRAQVWWTVGVVAFAVYTISFFPVIQENAEEFRQLFESFPEGLNAFLGGGAAELVTPTGYLQQQMFQLTVPLLFLIFAIRLGAGALAGEERAGTLDLLLATPVTRRRVLLDKFASMATATALLGVALWAATMGTLLLIGVEVSSVRVAEASLSAVLVGLTFGSLALAIGSATGSRGTAVGVATAVGVVGYSVHALSALVPALEPPALFSPFYYYGAAQPLQNGLDPLHVLVLVAVVVVLVLMSVVTFDRRDLAV